MTFTHIPIILPKIEQDYTEQGHYYKYEGIIYPSITTILHSFPNPGIESWKARTNNWQEILDESNEVGTQMHLSIEQHLRNEMETPCPDECNYISHQLFDNLKPELNKINNIKCLEASLYEPNLRISGRVDCVADFDGVPSIIDFKSSRKNKDKYIKKSGYFEQVTAYSKMYEYCAKEKIEQGIILIADWLGGVSVHKIKIDDYVYNLEMILEEYEMQSL